MVDKRMNYLLFFICWLIKTCSYWAVIITYVETSCGQPQLRDLSQQIRHLVLQSTFIIPFSDVCWARPTHEISKYKYSVHGNLFRQTIASIIKRQLASQYQLAIASYCMANNIRNKSMIVLSRFMQQNQYTYPQLSNRWGFVTQIYLPEQGHFHNHSTSIERYFECLSIFIPQAIQMHLQF